MKTFHRVASPENVSVPLQMNCNSFKIVFKGSKFIPFREVPFLKGLGV